MKILVLVQAYPSIERPTNQAFVHARILHYIKAGWDVDILSFSCRQSYLYDGVRVYSEKWLETVKTTYDVWVSHAPNLRNHLRLILSKPHKWKRLVWILHGHEVLIKQNYYPAPYPWMPQPSPLMLWADRLYDQLKTRVLALYLRNMIPQQKIQLIFVSHALKQIFLNCVPLSQKILEPVASVISNPVHPVFLQTEWSPPLKPRAEFITIRPLDESRCGLDQIYALAQAHPNIRFDIFGKGHFFEHNPLLPNMRWYDQFILPADIPTLLNEYRAALMPTRHDSQGVMVCEMATFGLPILTSDLPVCHEMLADFPRVGFLPKTKNLNLKDFLDQPLPARGNHLRFSPTETILKEMSVIQSGLAYKPNKNEV